MLELLDCPKFTPTEDTSLCQCFQLSKLAIVQYRFDLDLVHCSQFNSIPQLTRRAGNGYRENFSHAKE